MSLLGSDSVGRFGLGQLNDTRSLDASAGSFVLVGNRPIDNLRITVGEFHLSGIRSVLYIPKPTSKTLNSEQQAIKVIVNNLLDNLMATIPPQADQGAIFRHLIGEIRANFSPMLRNGTFSQNLLDCFAIIRKSNAKLASLFVVHNDLFAETANTDMTNALVQTAIVFCLSTEARMITDIAFVNRDDVEEMIKVMKGIFDLAIEMSADLSDTSFYRALIALSGSLTAHLATVARPLPRIISFDLKVPLPALSLSNLIYYTPERWEEIVAENRIVHPAFCPREIRGLSV